MIPQGVRLEAYKVLDRGLLPRVEKQAHGTQGQAANFYCIQV